MESIYESPIAMGEPQTGCMDCGWKTAQLINTPLRFDFDARLIPQELRQKFTTREDGICLGCGLYQDFARFDLEEMRAFARFNKDETVSESAYRTFPVPDQYVASFEANYAHQRLARWRDHFAGRGFSPEKCLFLRPMFGHVMQFALEVWRAQLIAVEISNSCRLTSEMRVPQATFLNAQIQGLIDETIIDHGPFDAIFVFHTLVHCVDIHRELALLGSMLAPGGVMVLSQEIQIKPQNPFHMLFPTEPQLMRLLGKHFDHIERINDCDPNPPEFITNHTMRRDSPDFAVNI